MGEPEVDPDAPPGPSGTLAPPQCDTPVANPEPHDPAPLSPITTCEAVAEDKAGDGDASAVPEVVVGGENEEAGDGGLSVKQTEVETEVKEGGEVEVESSAVEVSQSVETEAPPGAEIAGTEEVVEEEGKIEEAFSGDGDQTKLLVEEEVEGAAVDLLEGPVEDVLVAGSEDTMPKEEDKEEAEAEQEGLMEEIERKGEDAMDQETVCLDTNHKEAADEAQLEDNNLDQDEGDGGKATEGDSTQDGDGDKVMEKDLMQDVEGDDKAMGEDLPEDVDVDGDKVMEEEDMAPDDGDDNKAANEDGDGGDNGKADKREQDAMETNDGEEGEEEDEPPPLPAKKGGGSGGKKKRPRPMRIKKGEEELCFICFDGGELVVCDRRSEYRTALLRYLL